MHGYASTPSMNSKGTSVRPWFAADPSCGEHFTRGKLGLICGRASLVPCPPRLTHFRGSTEWLQVQSGWPLGSVTGWSGIKSELFDQSDRFNLDQQMVHLLRGTIPSTLRN